MAITTATRLLLSPARRDKVLGRSLNRFIIENVKMLVLSPALVVG